MTNMAPDSTEVDAIVDWRLAECARALRQVLLRRARARWWRVLLRMAAVGVLILLCLAIWGAALTNGWVGVWGISPWIVILVLWLALLGGGLPWFQAWHVRRNNPHMVSGQRHVITPDGYRVVCGEIEMRLPWSAFVQLAETPEFFLAYPQRDGAFYLPKRCLTSAQVGDVRQLFAIAGAARTALAA